LVKYQDLNMKESIGLPKHISTLICFDPTIVEDLSAELNRARNKFPSAFNLNFALMDEVGELVAAQMQKPSDEDLIPYYNMNIRKEAIQVMAMCVRIIEEGDKSLVLNEETTQK